MPSLNRHSQQPAPSPALAPAAAVPAPQLRIAKPELVGAPAPAAGQSRDLAVGGQAVLEGVMMRGVANWAVAVRLPDTHPTDPGGIAVTHEPFQSVLARHRFLRLPILRGSVALVESMGVGVRALGLSANAQAPEEEQRPLTGGAWISTIVLGLGMAVGLFFLLPATVVKLGFGRHVDGIEFVLIEKAVRLTIFAAYIGLVSRLQHLQRVFQYHGAEHKTIACLEAGQPLEPQNAQQFSRLHPRCGTSFLLIVMLVSIFVFAPFGNLPYGWLLLSRVLGIPVVAGIAFEAIKWMGRNRDLPLARALTWPGMQLQKMTTREPDLDQLAVAIAALKGVLAHEDPQTATQAQKAGLEVAA